MKTVIVFAVLLMPASILFGQDRVTKVPMTAAYWDAEPGRAEFITHNAVPAIKIRGGGAGELFTNRAQVVLKDVEFTNGTIHFDVELTDFFLSAIHFRRADAQHSDLFYLRTYRADDPTGPDAVQYTALTKGVALWDLHPRYQGPAVLHKEGWNHIKLVVADRHMQVFVNSETDPTLVVPQLAGEASAGRIAFEGGGIFANLVIEPGDTPDVSPEAGFDPTRYDHRYLHSWEVTQPVALPPGRELVSASGASIYSEHLPSDETVWETINAERDGLVNLSRRFGGNEARRVVWLKKTITSRADQSRQMSLGFSDEVWVLVNGRLVYVDKNLYGHPIMKDPFGQISIDDTTFTLPLSAGENELLIGVANSFFGWAIMARLDNMDGITAD
ncbi:MAG: hypothetical protein R2834_12870 [Rhodothermales bacterium]